MLILKRVPHLQEDSRPKESAQDSQESAMDSMED